MVFEGEGDRADDDARFEVLDGFDAVERDAEATRRALDDVFLGFDVTEADREEGFFFGLAFRAGVGLEAVFEPVFFDGTAADSLWFALPVFAIGVDGRTEEADAVTWGWPGGMPNPVDGVCGVIGRKGAGAF
ncbi:MAG TPA: hypothetical protein PKX87_05550 [Alphaproteobacteria bacterium]|nr:hypothetical protein [Alphaproteobacteria bacterium]